MITCQEEEYVFTNGYVPEHLVGLMSAVSKGEPFLIEDHLNFVKDNWAILVGYPLDQHFSIERCEKVVKKVVERFRPEYLWLIAPEIPAPLLDTCRERETDRYYRLDLEQSNPKPSLQRIAEKASKELTVERTRSFSKDHEALIRELLKREKLSSRITALYRAMPEYLSHSQTACVLNARDKKGRLIAFYVLDLGAKKFTTYLLGSHSKKHYVPHASDLLFLKMIELSREHGKNEINLGLGVNEGIRRFKEKWGGAPSLPYEFCECYYGTTRTLSLIKAIEGKL
ncbi:MAG: hypothetical protein HXY46_09085 [Syntrophaceae bacterium]|nr:hypothetical protein [Syntrophaceae bacterium]